MPSPIAFDLSRMIYGAASPSPRGIDRIDMGYARRLFDAPTDPVVGLLPSPAGMGVLRRDDALRLIAVLERHWREHQPAGEDAAFAAVLRWLSAAGETGASLARPPRRPRSGLARTLARYARLLLAARRAPFSPAAGTVPQGAVTLCVGQTALGFPWLFRWLDQRPDVKPVFMLHDLIPIVRPEFVLPPFSRHHVRMVETAARRARAMIAISESSADDLRQAMRRVGRSDIRIEVIPHPVDDQFLAGTPPRRAGLCPYFVTVGVIDPRKNHRVLLQLWHRMAEMGLPRIPKLVIAGSRGLRVAETRALLDRDPVLGPHVVEVSGLSSPALRDLIAGAEALLMPSFIEGFGLPIVEALALGTPVIASDIPAHREVASGRARLLDPCDGPSWLAAVLAGPQPRIVGYHAQTWSGYFDEVRAFLATV